jgi:hypothetical protein
MRMTGVFRAQSDNPEAPLGFELNNPWKVCHAAITELVRILTAVADGGPNFVKRHPRPGLNSAKFCTYLLRSRRRNEILTPFTIRMSARSHSHFRFHPNIALRQYFLATLYMFLVFASYQLKLMVDLRAHENPVAAAL